MGRHIEWNGVRFMSRRLDFGQDLRKRQARRGLRVKDEAEWMENDASCALVAKE
jgi:hypothetical protein